ncbi:MAG: TIGR02921 family PEP-CTERM protein [Chloroflexi bacterium]|nr:TIGR02921 family PEP-CTERM protein [Chloroflexota bacterium]
MKQVLRFIFDPRVWAYGLFWTWNLIFVAFMLLGFAPQMLPDLIAGVTTNIVPPLFLVAGITLTLIPVAAILLAIFPLRRAPEKLFALAYGIEWPLMFMLGLRFFLFRDANPAVALIMTLALIGMATLMWQLLDPKIDERGAPFAMARAIGLTFLLLTYLYASAWIAFYAVPLAAQIVNVVIELPNAFWRFITTFDWRALWTLTWAVPFSILSGLLFGYSATLLAITPIAVPILAMRAWWRGVRALINRTRAVPAYALVASVILISITAVIIANQQPQREAFARLQTPPATLDAGRALMRQADTLRAGLLNTYLAQFRYISAVGEVKHIGEMYKWSMKLSLADALQVQALYETVASPLLYEPINPAKPDNREDGRALRQEPEQAAKMYKAVFDERILDGERTIIANTVRATWSASQAEAALQAVDDHEILLTHQAITISERGDWADVELHEVYQNQTTQRQEVVYYFSLPESAVVTGVWLGASDDRNARFAYRVAPRGAAQAVYRNEVRRNVDPALVEQIGPRQYRLRIFPIEPRLFRRDPNAFRSTITDAARMHMWLTYRVLARDNAWALPRLAEKRNVYWDATTTRVLNGKALQTDAWLPASIPATSPPTQVAHQIEFVTGETVIARPLSALNLPALRDNLRVAVVLDRSLSMQKFAADVKTTVARLDQFANADVYLTASQYRGEPASRAKLDALNLDRIEYLGGQHAGELLAQFDALRANDSYDAIFVVTDGSGYELGESPVKVPIPNAPVWMIHLGGALPLGYDDATLEAIQASGGGVTTSVEDALNRVAVALNAKAIASSDIPANATVDWVDGYAWFTITGASSGVKSSSAITNDDFAPFAARRVILDAMYRNRANLRQLTTLDQLHAIAIKHSIVTPFSSMLVLVNAQQLQLLKQLEQQGDRFDREVEQVGETLGQNALDVTAVPEPHEWLLIALALVALGYIYKTRVAARGVA